MKILFIQLSMEVVPKNPMTSEAALVQAMAWHQTGDKPLSEQMTVWFIYAYICQSALTSRHLYQWNKMIRYVTPIKPLSIWEHLFYHIAKPLI